MNMNKIKEIWKPIPKYEGLYEVSNLGRVRSLDRIKPNSGGQIASGAIKSLVDNGRGYKVVSLYRNNIGSMKYVHRLVAEAFVANPHNFPEVNHKDENKSNNTACNLEWCTRVYNNNYGTKSKRCRETYVNHDRNRQIDMYDMNGTFIKTFLCSNDIKGDIEIDRRSLYNVCTGIAKSYNNYRFAFHGEQLRPLREKRSKKVIVLKYKDDILLTQYNSLRQAEIDNNMYRGFLRISNIKHHGDITKDGFRYILS